MSDDKRETEREVMAWSMQKLKACMRWFYFGLVQRYQKEANVSLNA